MTQLGLESINGTHLEKEWVPGAKVNTHPSQYSCHNIPVSADCDHHRHILEPLFQDIRTCFISTESTDRLCSVTGVSTKPQSI